MNEHDDWLFRGAVYSAAQGHAKALTQLFLMLADEERPLTHKDRLALIDLIKHLTASGKRGRRPSRIFSRAWLVQQLTKEARGRHRQEQEAWRRDRRKNPRPSLKRCAEQAVKHWANAEPARTQRRTRGPRPGRSNRRPCETHFGRRLKCPDGITRARRCQATAAQGRHIMQADSASLRCQR